MKYVLTAHHLDDSIETFFINLTRSTGIKGLLGLRNINENIIRPMLIFSKSQIFSFAYKKIKLNGEKIPLTNHVIMSETKLEMKSFLFLNK